MPDLTLWKKCKSDRRYFFRNCLKIRTLDDGHYKLKPFIMNQEQEQILRFIEDQEARNKPVRLIILKSRKVGVSTLIEAVGFHYTLFHKNAQAKCIAHLEKATDRIFDITRRYWDNLPKQLKDIAPGKASGRGIRLSHQSVFEIQTQGSTDAARGDTPSFLHLSELALWENRRAQTTAEDVLQATFGSIEDEPGTSIIIESTANGPRGAFYERFKKALSGESEHNLFQSLFFGWQDHRRYRLEPRPEDDQLQSQLVSAHTGGDAEAYHRTAMILGYSDFWAERAVEFDLRPHQIRWALQTCESKFGGDIQRFDVEYPLSWQIAFTASGGSPFDQEKVVKRLDELKARPMPVSFRTIGEDGQSTAPGDAWQIYHPPVPGNEYLVAVDAATGIEKGDYACIQVLDRSAKQQVAEFYAKMPPDGTAIQASNAAKAYNDAILAPEVDGPGLALVRSLLDLDGGYGYQNLYRRSFSTNWTQSWGFKTTGPTRHAAIEALAKAIRDGIWEINSTRLLHECQTFIQSQSGKFEALQSEHDDAVMAMAIGLYLDVDLGEVAESKGPSRPATRRVAHDVYVSELMLPDLSDRDPHLGRWW